jgi:hypothetical protein
MDCLAGKRIALRATFFRSALKMKAVREVPEGLCKHCAGTGNGEEMADLGETLFHGCEFPRKQCKSCGGSGMAIAKVEITALGLLLGCLMPLAIWVFPWRMQLIFMSSVVSIAALEAIRWHYQNTEKKIKSDGVKQRTEIAPVPDLTPTAELLSLIDALQNNRQTADQENPIRRPAIRTSAQ